MNKISSLQVRKPLIYEFNGRGILNKTTRAFSITFLKSGKLVKIHFRLPVLNLKLIIVMTLV